MKYFENDSTRLIMMNSKNFQKISLPALVATVAPDSFESLRVRLAFSTAGRLCALGLTVSQIVSQVRPPKIRRFHRKYS